jgi:hypothetical protein
MSALPRGQSAILNGGYSAWQAPLAAIFSGIGAAGQPGGWNNFSQGVQSGLNNFQQNQMQMGQAQRAEDLFKMQQEEFADKQRRANQEEAQRQATIDSLDGLLNPQQPAQGGQPVAAMFSGRPSQPAPNQSALFGEYAGIPPHARQSAILSGYSEEVLRRGTEPDGTINLDRAGGGGLNDGAGVQQAYDGTQSQNAGGMQILGRHYTDAQLAALRSMAANDPDGVMKILQEGAFAEPDQADAPTIKDFYEGDRIVQKQWNPDTGSWDVVGQGGRWSPKSEGGGLSVDINGDGVPDIQMGNIKSQWQSQDNAFANRLDNSIVEMDTVEAEGYDPTATTAGGLADYVGQRSVGGLIGNVMTSDQGKRWYRSAKEALAVVLRKDTGAAVTDHEFELYGPLYIPMPWDDASTKASKKQALLVMRNSLRQGIGQGQLPPPTAPTQTPAPAPTAPGAGGNPDDPLNLFVPQQ